MPWLDKLWTKNKLVSLFRPATYSPMVSFALARQAERFAATPSATASKNDRDFLSRFIAAMDKDPSIPKW